MQSILRTFFSGASLFLICFLPLAGQETLSSVQRELDRVEKEIAREKDLHQSELKRAQAFEKSKAEKFAAINRQLVLSQNKVDSLKKEVARSGARKNAHRNQIALYQRKQEEFRAHLVKESRELASFFRQDFPYQHERRIAELENLSQSLEAGTLGVEEGLFRIFGAIEEAVGFSRDSEVYAGVHRTLDGRNLDGKFVRLGAVFLGFVSQDGKHVAHLAPSDSGYVWLDTDVSPEARKGVVLALSVAEGKTPPELVSLPFIAVQPKSSGKPKVTPAASDTATAQPIKAAPATGGRP